MRNCFWDVLKGTVVGVVITQVLLPGGKPRKEHSLDNLRMMGAMGAWL